MSKKLTPKMIFNEDTINVFTDASMEPDNYHGCAGAVLVDQFYKATYRDIVLKKSNTYRSELIAIKLGIIEGLKTGRKNINIFSDSLLSINGLRKWVFNWQKRSKDDILLTSEDKKVVNMDIIYDIIKMITKHDDRNINLFHQKGHIGPKDTAKVMALFKRTNGYSIDRKMVAVLKQYNDMVDHCTRTNLKTRNTIKRRYKAHGRMFYKLPNSKKLLNKYKEKAIIKI